VIGARIMYDCIHDNVAAVKAVIKPGDLVALYDTGSPISGKQLLIWLNSRETRQSS